MRVASFFITPLFSSCSRLHPRLAVVEGARDAILVDDLDVILGGRGHQTLPHLRDALIHQVRRLLPRHLRLPVLVEERKGEHSSVPVPTYA